MVLTEHHVNIYNLNFGIFSPIIELYYYLLWLLKLKTTFLRPFGHCLFKKPSPTQWRHVFPWKHISFWAKLFPLISPRKNKNALKQKVKNTSSSQWKIIFECDHNNTYCFELVDSTCAQRRWFFLLMNQRRWLAQRELKKATLSLLIEKSEFKSSLPHSFCSTLCSTNKNLPHARWCI